MPALRVPWPPMSARQRIAILVAAVVILVGGFVLAQGSADDENDDATVTSAGSGGATAPAETQAGVETQPQQTQTQPPVRVETIRMKGRAPVGEPRTLKFENGDTVRLRFVSDVAEEVHIHGYDRYVQVPAGGSARTRFTANAEGVFEIESHGSGEILANLEVRP